MPLTGCWTVTPFLKICPYVILHTFSFFVVHRFTTFEIPWILIKYDFRQPLSVYFKTGWSDWSACQFLLYYEPSIVPWTKRFFLINGKLWYSIYQHFKIITDIFKKGIQTCCLNSQKAHLESQTIIRMIESGFSARSVLTKILWILFILPSTNHNS